MNISKSNILCRIGLVLALFSIWSLPQSVGAAPLAQIPTGPLDAYNGIPDYYTTANWANSPPLAKFVDTLPGLTAANANNLGQYLPVATPDTTTFPGSDYYIIELREYSKKMHSDLNPTKLRGYVQVDSAGADVAPINYLGPIIVATKDRPVRLKFINKLPTGTGGDLFIPVDETYMGAGEGPIPGTKYTQNRADIHLHGGRTPWISDGTPHQWITPAGENTPYVQGVSMQNVPDMCFQKVAPYNAIPKATDPNCLTGTTNPGPGAASYFFTNQQSTRLMFYHDHAFGITRLNVYAGEAAGYVITDPMEQDLVDRGIIPGTKSAAAGGGTVMGGMIPLIIQDKTFVDATPTVHPVTGQTVPKVRITDPLWNWGSSAPVGGVVPPVTGDLWMPHVYMPAQLPEGSNTGGVNPFGRWMYGPWFYPATNVVHGPVANPYYDPNCSSSNPFLFAQCQTPGQPSLIPGTPNVSSGMEAFQDSVVVNGTAFPTLTVDPTAYRFRILNAANDRFQNLSFYVADTTAGNVSPAVNRYPAGTDARGYLRSNQTEVKMVTASQALADAAAAAGTPWPADWPVDGRDGGVPDPAFMGPSFLQIGTEGGFLPKPVVIAPQPITYITDPTAFWVGNVDKMGLALGPAERADVIVDFSAYAGKTLILYNDAPAAWPARVPGYDYYTGAPDLRDSGGYGTGGTFDPATGSWVGGTGPLPGFAPNTRTVMQVIVRNAAPAPFNPVPLENEFTSAAPVTVANPNGLTLFERTQEPIIVGQAAYAPAYPASYFPPNFPWEGVNQINDHFLQFVTVAGDEVKVTTEPKGIHDEMGASFDPEYGRMSGNLAMQLPNPTTLNALLVLYGYSDLPTEVVKNSTSLNVQVLPNPIAGEPGSVADGTQIWKISHNGVDTHPIHFHIFDVQLINRVGWDGQILMPEPNELGWKDTVKISPLEDTIVAVRPRAPALPFGIPNSLRPLNPAIPIDSAMNFTTPTPGSDWVMGNSFLPPFGQISGFSSIDWTTGQAYVYTPAVPPLPATPVTPAYPYEYYKGVVTNVLYNFGWEYVWHCHILSHEEMDMMRPIVLKVDTTLPPAFTVSVPNTGTNRAVTWTDPTPVDLTNYSTFGNPANEIGFNVYRISTTASATTPFTKLNTAGMLPANATAFTDTTATSNGSYIYQVEAVSAAGSTYATTSRMTVTLGTSGTLTAPATLTLTGTVSNKPSAVSFTKVEFFNGTTLIGSDTTPNTTPYRFVWNNVPAGTYSLTVKITDNRGGVTVSPAINRTVTGTLTANFTATGSAGGADIGVCETVTLTSTSTASTGTISNYTWLVGGTNYSYPTNTVDFTNLPVGVNPITLTVSKVTGETASITKNVTIVNHLPVAITGGPYTVLPGNNLTLNGSGTDADPCDTLTYAWNIDNRGAYDFFTANPTMTYASLLQILGPGIHTMTFQVTDSNGGTTTATTTVMLLAAPTITSPTGLGIGTTPVYTFSPVPGATGYSIFLWNYTTQTGGTTRWYTAAEAGCPSGTGTCTITQAPALSAGPYAWFARAQTAAADGPWSNYLDFTVGSIPPATTLISPTGGGIAATPNYTFNAVAGATGYSVFLWNYTTQAGGATRWYTAAEAGCPTGTGTCTIAQATPLAAGPYAWYARAQNATGDGPWSALLDFSVGAPPVAPVLISPTGAGITTTPTYTFNAVAGATYYSVFLWNYTTQAGGATRWYTAAEAGCPNGTGTCTILQATPLTSGNNYAWFGKALNGAGEGPWSGSIDFSVQ